MLLRGAFMGWLEPDALIKLLAGKANKLSSRGVEAKGEGGLDGWEGRWRNPKMSSEAARVIS